MNTNWLDYTLLTLVIIGAINWGLIGFFRFDLVAFIFGNMSWFSRIIYALVGLGGLYLICRKKSAVAIQHFFFAGRDFLCLIDRADAPEQADHIL